MRCRFGLFGALAQVGCVAEAEDVAGKFSERAVDLIFGPLNGEHVHKIQRGSVELFEHLVAGAPLSQEALADLTEDLDAIMGADLGAAQCLCELLTDISIVQFALGGLVPRDATAEIRTASGGATVGQYGDV